MSVAEIARTIKLSRPATTERLRRLEDAQIITGYHAKINLEKLGLKIRAYLRIKTPNSRFCSDVTSAIANIPEVLECARVAGTDDLIAKVAIADIPHLESVVDSIAHKTKVTTLIILSDVVKRRAISPASFRH